MERALFISIDYEYDLISIFLSTILALLQFVGIFCTEICIVNQKIPAGLLKKQFLALTPTAQKLSTMAPLAFMIYRQWPNMLLDDVHTQYEGLYP